MSIKLDDLSAKELEALIARASLRRKQLAKRKPIAVVREKLAALARAEGYTLAEITGTGAAVKPPATPAATARRSRGPSSNKYRHPGNATQTWAGRGQQPKWLAAEIAKGNSLEDFSIR